MGLLVNLLKRVELLNKKLWQPLLSLVLRNEPTRGAIPPEQVKKILLLRLDRIGDMVVSTPLFRSLRCQLSGTRIGVFGGYSNVDLLRDDDNITWTYRRSRNPFRTILETLRARKEKFDVLINLNFNPSLTAGLIANVAAPHAMKVSAISDPSNRFFYNMTLDIERDLEKPMTHLILRFMEAFGKSGEGEDASPYLVLGSDTSRKAERFLRKKGLERGRFVVLNPFAGDGRRDLGRQLTRDITLGLGKAIGKPVVILRAPGREVELSDILLEEADRALIPGPTGCDILETAALISAGAMIVSPDTSIVHIAEAVGRPVVAIYSHLVPSYREWRPSTVPSRLVYAEGLVNELEAAPIIQAAVLLHDLIRAE